MIAMHDLLEKMISSEASDLHIAEGGVPFYRVHGKLVSTQLSPLDHAAMSGLLQSICAPDRWQHFLEHGDLDFAYALGEKARFRVNYLRKHTGLGAVLRIIPTEIMTLEELNLPPVLGRFAELRSGMVLVTGPTGSGKSTTLAAIIDRINSQQPRHIVTIEDPIEFVHVRKRALISQREVGMDTNTFADALRSVSRQDADVILVGEMRDLETIQSAVSAAEMGALVFGTLHTNSASKTVDRIIDVFPSNQQAQIRTQLAESLKGICAQLLLKTKDGKGRAAANEILVGNRAVANCIREGNTAKLPSVIQSSRGEGMQLMDDAISQLLKQGKITEREAYLKATDKKRFRVRPDQE